MKVDIKRGYAKWVDENGKFHKVPVEEYNKWKEEDGQPLSPQSEEQWPSHSLSSTSSEDLEQKNTYTT